MTLRTIEEINLAYNKERENLKNEHKARKATTGLLNTISDILFYVAVTAILYSALSADAGSTGAKNIFGFTSYVVMTSSMKDEIPKGSLIISQKTDPKSLIIGDNITFLRNSEVIITHKIVSITEPSDNISSRQFQTKGTNNASPDDYIVSEGDVLGKVIIVLPAAGTVINSLNENIHMIIIIFILCSLLSFLFKGISQRRTATQTRFSK